MKVSFASKNPPRIDQTAKHNNQLPLLPDRARIDGISHDFHLIDGALLLFRKHIEDLESIELGINLLSNMEELNLAYNKIRDINHLSILLNAGDMGPFSTNYLPRSESFAKSLKKLDLSGNPIEKGYEVLLNFPDLEFTSGSAAVTVPDHYVLYPGKGDTDKAETIMPYSHYKIVHVGNERFFKYLGS